MTNTIPPEKLQIGLIGNPNCGKTTLFNALTGSHQRVGNWTGVTVERKSGFFTEQDRSVEVIDLPGLYSLTTLSDTTSLDEQIACEYILSNDANVLINIIDASNLERNLYLTTQLLEMRIPLVVVLNMMDVAQQKGLAIDAKQISKQLGCTVIPLTSHKKNDIQYLKKTIYDACHKPSISKKQARFPLAVQDAINDIKVHLANLTNIKPEKITWLGLRLLEEDAYAKKLISHEDQANNILRISDQQRAKLETTLDEEADIILANSRYEFAHKVTLAATVKNSAPTRNITAVLDKIILNRFFGIPIFLAVMYLMFVFAINIGGLFQGFFDISSDTLFVQGLSHWLSLIGLPAWFTAIVASGIGKGINTTITFTPIIGGMFLFLSFLEDSGYMARAAFVVDRFMCALGLPGKSFVPLIVGFGCNVPAIMAARTLENKRDRILTVMMSPFMSCGARLAIFAVFTAAFFPAGGQNIVFSLYIIGITAAVITGLVLRKTILKGTAAPLIMELPPYHIPKLTAMLKHTWFRLKSFLWKAGRIIIPVCIIIGALNAITIHGTLDIAGSNQHSLLSEFGRFVTPIFAPMGLHTDNWPATVGLLTGILAKEVVIGTLNTLYTQVGHLSVQHAGHFDLWAGLLAAVKSIPNNIQNLGSAFVNPILASAPDHSVNQGVLGLMSQRFDGRIGAFAYLLFVLLYIPCVSTTAAITRELGYAWSLFSLFWNTLLAYGIAVIFYQVATIMNHPQSSLIWIVAIVTVYLSIFMLMRLFANQDEVAVHAN